MDSARILALDRAFREGDLEMIERLVDQGEDFPNGPMPLAIGRCLEYAIYHGPFELIAALLERGADPTPEDHGGFPPLIAAIQNPTRPDTEQIVRLLLRYGGDPNQHGFNDYTALHWAVSQSQVEVARLLLEAGGDPDLRTRIDDLESPRDLAMALGHPEMIRLLELPRR